MLNTDGYFKIFQQNLSNFSNKKLCEIIITARYFGSMNEESILCMTELAKRRDLGDTFDYESFIEIETHKLPDFKINLKKKIQVGGLDLANIKLKDIK